MPAVTDEKLREVAKKLWVDLYEEPFRGKERGRFCLTREQLRIAIITWIERTYHRRRRQARLGRLTPIEFEPIMNEELALAA